MEQVRCVSAIVLDVGVIIMNKTNPCCQGVYSGGKQNKQVVIWYFYLLQVIIGSLVSVS